MRSVWPLTSAGLLLLYGVLKSVHVVLAAVERPSGDVHTHWVDTHIVWPEHKVLRIKRKRWKTWGETSISLPWATKTLAVNELIPTNDQLFELYCVVSHLYYEPRRTPPQTSWPALWTPGQLSWGPAGNGSCTPQCWHVGSERKEDRLRHKGQITVTEL